MNSLASISEINSQFFKDPTRIEKENLVIYRIFMYPDQEVAFAAPKETERVHCFLLFSHPLTCCAPPYLCKHYLLFDTSHNATGEIKH
jgi:hypothetical protein